MGVSWLMRRGDEIRRLKCCLRPAMRAMPSCTMAGSILGVELIVKPFGYAALAAKLKTVLEGK